MSEFIYQAMLRLMLVLFRDKMRRDYKNGSTWQLHKEDIEQELK